VQPRGAPKRRYSRTFVSQYTGNRGKEYYRRNTYFSTRDKRSRESDIKKDIDFIIEGIKDGTLLKGIRLEWQK